MDLAIRSVSSIRLANQGTGQTNIWGIIMDRAMALMIGFNIFVLAMLALDLGVLHRKAKAVPPRQAMFMCFGYMTLAAIFGAGVFYFAGQQAGYEFFAGYIIEQSLSVDNMFVFLLIFTHFQIAPQHQHRVLFYGVLGALVMRGLFIYVGVTLVHMSHWVMAGFGVLLLYTAFKMLIAIEQEPDIEQNRILKFARRRLPMVETNDGGRFFIRKNGKLHTTPLFLVLILVETTDILFAFDSIPAIFAVTQDPFIIYTSNVFAILGLRALYFALAGAMDKFHYLKYGVSLTLMAIGVKMTYGSVMGAQLMSTEVALGLTAFLILGSIGFSLAVPVPAEEAPAKPTGWVIGSPSKEPSASSAQRGDKEKGGRVPEPEGQSAEKGAVALAEVYELSTRSRRFKSKATRRAERAAKRARAAVKRPR